jgi:DNA uptake protein ComE-like DNA-binding protein
MKRRVSIAGLVPVLAVSMAMVACSHNKSQEKESGQQAGQSAQSQKTQSTSGSQAQTGQTGQTAQTQSNQSNQSNMMLGEQNTSAGTAQIQRQKKVVSTVIVKEKIPTVKESTIRADINRMDAKQFTAIGFPSDVSQNIVQYRDRNGPFHSVNDLANVDGVSQSLLDKFDGSLGVNQSAAGISGQGLSQGQGMTNQQQSGQQQPGQQGSSSQSNQDYPAYDSSSPNLNQ